MPGFGTMKRTFLALFSTCCIIALVAVAEARAADDSDLVIAPSGADWSAAMASGHIPGVDEAKRRLEHLTQHGPTQFAFTFKSPFEPDEAFQSQIDGAGFEPCGAK